MLIPEVILSPAALYALINLFFRAYHIGPDSDFLESFYFITHVIVEPLQVKIKNIFQKTGSEMP